MINIIKPGYEILTPISDGGIKELQKIELAARTCYKSEDKISPDGESAKKLVKNLIKSGHEAMLEHGSLSVKFICDRGVSHELVRHRIASYAQESTRYCNYGKDKFGNSITVIEPCFYDDISDEDKKTLRDWVDEWDVDSINEAELSKMELSYTYWYGACIGANAAYFGMLRNGATPQEARAVLPNSLKTEVVMTANYREWRNVFKLRCANDAHPQIREIMIPLCIELRKRIPILFDDCYPLGQEVTERYNTGKPIAGRYPMT
jgi:thymidylate synthase (FAD)